jgi:Fur family peroxide stress response transcriptional regulator
MDPVKDYPNSNFRLTPQRIGILDSLKGNQTHPSAEEIYRAVSKKFPTMAIATVYNTLSVLKKRGQIVELNIDPTRARYAPNTSPHHHLMCTNCRAIVDLEARYQLTFPETAFDITGSRVDSYGLCPKCRKGEGRG